MLDQDDRFVGALSEGDLLRAVLPPFHDMLEADRTIDPLVEPDVVTLRPTDEVAAAAVLMMDRAQRRVPVVVGREEGPDTIVLDELAVSRGHARLEFEGCGWELDELEHLLRTALA